METLSSKRKLNELVLETETKQTPVGKFVVTPSQIVRNSQSSPQQSSEKNKATAQNRTVSVPSLKFFTFAPMNQGAASNKVFVSSSPTSNSPDGTSTRKFRYTSLNNNLKRPPIRQETCGSVTSSVATQTSTSFLQNSLAANKQQATSNETNLLAVCAWCGCLSKNFTNCDRCKHALDSDLKTYNPQTMKLAKLNQQTPTITTIIPQTTIVLAPQDPATGTTALLASPAVIKTGQFYGQQLSLQSPVATRLVPQAPNGTSKVLVVGKQPTAIRSYRGKKKAEPECLTISSDEEEGNQVPGKTSIQVQADHLLNTSSANKDGPPGFDFSESSVTCTALNQTAIKETTDAWGVSSPSWSSSSPLDSSEQVTEEDKICIKCRSIRIGSYKVQAYDHQALNVIVTSKEIKFTVSCIEGARVVDISIQKDDIPSVLAHFGKVLPVLFIYTTPGCAGTIRNLLSMNRKDKPYYDPCSSEECMKRITILPFGLSDPQKTFLSNTFPGTLLQEIKQALANEVLIRSTPVHGSSFIGINVHKLESRLQSPISQPAKSKKEVVKLVTYPPPPQTGGIEINSEDLECLNEGEFLNDVIIDFYLKYLVNEKLSPADREQTHIFSSFFFPRLTTKHTDEEITANISRRRHARVKTWTRHVDIFEKDFIVVPINQNSHWFLAIICFPGMLSQDMGKPSGDRNDEIKGQDYPDGEECEPSSSQGSPTGSLALDPMDLDDQESPVPAPALVCPMTTPLSGLEETETPNWAPQTSPNTSTDSIDKGPCILIFDSLPGNHRWKVVQTLREYLTIEYEMKKKMTKVFDRNTMRGMNVTSLPRQENYTDCGIFLLQYVESFFENPLKNFSCPLPCLQEWFQMSKISGKRQELRELILSLQKQQQENFVNKDNGTSRNNHSEKSV